MLPVVLTGDPFVSHTTPKIKNTPVRSYNTEAACAYMRGLTMPPIK